MGGFVGLGRSCGTLTSSYGPVDGEPSATCMGGS